MEKSQAMALFNKAIKRISKSIREVYLKEAEYQFDSKIKGSQVMKNIAEMNPADIENINAKQEYEMVHNQVYSGIEDELLKKREECSHSSLHGRRGERSTQAKRDHLVTSNKDHQQSGLGTKLT